MDLKLKKIVIMFLVLTIIIFIIIILYDFRLVILGETILNKKDLESYTYTTAICNQSNFCQDYEITCENNVTIKLKPITGASIQYSKNWKDPRNNFRLCS